MNQKEELKKLKFKKKGKEPKWNSSSSSDSSSDQSEPISTGKPSTEEKTSTEESSESDDELVNQLKKKLEEAKLAKKQKRTTKRIDPDDPQFKGLFMNKKRRKPKQVISEK